MNTDKTIQSAYKHYQAGRLQEAEDLYRKILKKKPEDVDALHFLGIIAYQRGDLDSAIKYIRKELQVNPSNPDAYNNLGLAFLANKQLDEAITNFSRSLELNPRSPLAHYNLANVFKDKGDIDSAISNYKKALNIDPNLVYAYNNLGIACLQKGDIDEAIRNFNKALQLNHNLANTHYNLAICILKKGRLDEAITSYRRALQLNPHYVEVYKDLGVALHIKGEIEGAIDSYHKAIEHNPCQPDVYNNLGLVVQEKGQLEKAMSCFQQAIAIDSHYTDAYINLGNLLKDLGKLKEAQDNYRSALLLKPERAIAYSNLLFTMSYDPTYDAQTIFREHLEFSNRYSGPLSLIQRSHTNDRNPDRRLKIGYVSPDFRKHSVAFFIEPALSFHTREKYETFCYSDMLFPDTVTQRIQNHSDQWRNISGMSDEHVSEMILNDRIDILIDLAGHTGKNRMLMFSRKPAPVQVSWIGYPGTTGLSVMDYKIVDNYTDPEGMTEQFYTEKLLRMPESFLCYLPFQESPEIKPLPSLTKGSITFGSFNNFSKMSNETLDSWARLLNELSGSHLILKSQALTVKESRDRVIDIFKKENVSEDRIEFMSFVPSYQTHLDLYNRIDIALDTFPYNGTTTTCEALWMGVPVVTLAGNSHVSRVGVSLLSNAGIPELIAKDIDEYVSIASGLANDTERLIMLRHNLRQMISRSPLCNAKKFTNNLEHIYRTIWEDRCNMENTGETRG